MKQEPGNFLALKSHKVWGWLLVLVSKIISSNDFYAFFSGSGLSLMSTNWECLGEGMLIFGYKEFGNWNIKKLSRYFQMKRGGEFQAQELKKKKLPLHQNRQKRRNYLVQYKKRTFTFTFLQFDQQKLYFLLVCVISWQCREVARCFTYRLHLAGDGWGPLWF